MFSKATATKRSTSVVNRIVRPDRFAAVVTSCGVFLGTAVTDAFDEDEIDDEEDAKKTIIPFQLAYAVSIHKAQGLEYDSVKVVIPSVNTEKITKGVFYTAITRTKKKLTIYWSSETMEAIISGFSSEHNGFKSLEIIKNKLVQTTSSS